MSVEPQATLPDVPEVDAAPPALSSTMSLSEAVIAEKYWSAKRKELEYLERAGELVNAKAIDVRLTTLFAQCRTKLLGITSKVKTALPHLGHADIAAIDRHVREALEELGAPVVQHSKASVA